MTSIPTQEEFRAASRKGQEAVIAAIKAWFETVRSTTPKLTSVYAPLTERLPKLPHAYLPFADKLPTPEEAVGNAYHLAEELLASQRKFTEDVLKALAPLMPGRGEDAAEGNGSSKPESPSRGAWREAVAKPVAVSEPKPVAVSEPEPVAISQPKPVAVSEPKPVVSEAKPVVSEAKPAAPAGAEPKAPTRTSAKSTPARPTSRTTAAKSGAARKTSASRAPKGTDAA